MKAHPLILCAAGLALAAPGFAQPKLPAGDLPEAVRETIERRAGSEPVKAITRQDMNGRTTYLVELERDDAINPRFRVSAEGELMPEPPVPADTSGTFLDPYAPAPITYDALTLEDLPDAVQATVRKEAGGREIADIDRESWDGRTVYEVEFADRGLNPQIHVAEDGGLLPRDQWRGAVRDFLLGTQVTDTPPPVQETIKREASGRPINDIDVERRTGETIYEVEIRDPQSGLFQLHVDPAGRILKDSRVGRSDSQP